MVEDKSSVKCVYCNYEIALDEDGWGFSVGLLNDTIYWHLEHYQQNEGVPITP